MRGTPPSAANRAFTASSAITARTSAAIFCTSSGGVPPGNTPAQFTALIEADRQRYAQVIQDKKITVD